jgi:hypothetical protein
MYVIAEVGNDTQSLQLSADYTYDSAIFEYIS